MTALFVTGTDTDSGKTLVTLALMQALQDKGLTVNGYKPVAAGINQEGLNSDALLIQKKSTMELGYKQVNPYLFAPPIAPHIAAAQVNKTINMAKIAVGLKELQSSVDAVIVEGAGGWLVPLNENEDVAEIAVQNALPVLLVVGLKLGCINHARLTADSVQARGGHLIGWIGTDTDKKMINVGENIQTLKHYIDAECLGIIPFLDEMVEQKAASLINAERLMQLMGLG